MTEDGSDAARGTTARFAVRAQAGLFVAVAVLLGAGLVAVAADAGDGGRADDQSSAISAPDAESGGSQDRSENESDNDAPAGSAPPATSSGSAAAPKQPLDEPPRVSPRIAVARAGTYTYRDTERGHETTRTYSRPEAVEGDGGGADTVQTIRQGSKGNTERLRFSDAGVRVELTIFSGPPNEAPRQCAWEPNIEILKFPLSPGHTWSSTGTCSYEDRSSKQKYTRSDTVKVIEQRQATHLGEELDVVVIESETVFKVESTPKFKVQDYDGPYGSEMVTRRASTISTKYGVPLIEEMSITSDAPAGAASAHYRFELTALSPT